MDILKMKKICNIASGREKAHIVLKNANLVNVFTEEIIKGDVAIYEDVIAGIGSYEGEREVDCRGKFVCPGFIDAHMHIESTMVMPLELSKAVIKSGTTTLIADPHEMVNVVGSKAIDFLIDATEHIPVNTYIMHPSSVPATEFETNGADFTSQDMEQYLSHNRVLGLGEVMCFNDVINAKEHILQKISIMEGKTCDGHAPNVKGKALQAYAGAGVDTEHECVNFEEALEKVRAGLKILIREGSGAKNLEAIVSGLIESKVPDENFMFCTDDKHLEDIQREGHVRWCVKRAIDIGMEPARAIKMATYNAARTYGLKRLGAVAAGYRADIVVLDNIEDVSVAAVYKDGVLVEEKMLQGYKGHEADDSILNTVRFEEVTADKIGLEAANMNHVIEIVPYQLLTNKLYERVPQRGGYFAPNADYSKLCVVERHRMSGNVAVAPLKGFGIKNGAMATSVAHDSHNIIAVGDNDEDIVIAVNHMKKIQGGYAIVSKGEVVGELPLSVAGLISTLSGEQVQRIAKDMISTAREMGVLEGIDPFITLSFLALPVIPHIRLTDMGLFDVDSFEII